MRPTEAWNVLGAAPERRMRVCVRMGDGSELMAVRGGTSGDGEVALRLPGGLQERRIRGPWSGIVVDQFARNSDPEVVYLTLGCDPPYRAVFGHLCDDLAVRLEGATDAREAQSRLLDHLLLWAGFLRPGGSRLDSRTARGLFGELRFLEDVLAPSAGWQRTVIAWEGPGGAANDINLRPELSIDVKTTEERRQLATISSVEQLDPQGVARVLIAQAVVIEGSGETLGELAARVVAAAEVDGAGHLMRARLAQIGALHTDDAGPQLSLLAWQFHQVDDPAFPRLLRAGLPEAIRQCSYQIDLAMHLAPRPGLDQITSMIRQALLAGEST